MAEDGGKTIGYSVPTNGTTSSVDVMCVMKNSKSKDLAYKFMDMFYNLQNAVKNAEYNGVPMPVKGLYDELSDEYKAIPFMKVTKELKSKCENIVDIGDKLDMYSKAWDRVKSGR
jgi:spermidine/putrescine transport system substrate-binding protein